MSALKRYIIQFGGLSIGNHNFEFHVDDAFFENFEYSEIKEGDVFVDVSLEKQETMLILNFSIKGNVNIICDRCSDFFDLPISTNQQLIVKFGDEDFEETDDIFVIPFNEHKIDLSQLIYEYINLSVPIKRVHPDNKHGNSTCDPEIIKIIEGLSENNSTDNRWDALKKLKNKTK
ncbi:MAG: DUF177 domain-containing protein [Bacteroidales bacterium]|nr:DUF177 domain-containing protein [Bacteroidales bacterium]